MTMIQSGCDGLDGFLGGWLSDSEKAEFETHLENCSSCREEAERQWRIDRWLAEATVHLDRPPADLAERVSKRLRRAALRRRLAWGSGVAASLAAGVAVWFAGISTEPHLEQANSPVLREAAQVTQLSAVSEPSADVSFDPSTDVIAVPKTSNRRVTIVWTYPTVKASRQLGSSDSLPTAVP